MGNIHLFSLRSLSVFANQNCRAAERTNDICLFGIRQVERQCCAQQYEREFSKTACLSSAKVLKTLILSPTSFMRPALKNLKRLRLNQPIDSGSERALCRCCG